MLEPRPPAEWPASYFTGPLGRQNILPPAGKRFLGIMPNGSGWQAQQARIVDLEQRLGRRFDFIGVHYGGGGAFGGVSPCAWITTSERREQWIHERGSIPTVSWSPDISPQTVASGSHDACFRAVADYLKQFGFRIMLRMWWEFNGSWMPWRGCGQAHIDGWRRVVSIFRERGATNVGFWWCPQEGYDRACASNSYPGDEYVDWVGSDAYNWCYVNETSCWSTPLRSGWAEFGEIFNYGPNPNSAHDTFGPRKPFVVGETNTVYDPANPAKKGQWYRNIPAAARQMRYLTGIQFFDWDVSAVEGPKTKWLVDYPTSEPSVFAGFRAMALEL